MLAESAVLCDLILGKISKPKLFDITKGALQGFLERSRFLSVAHGYNRLTIIPGRLSFYFLHQSSADQLLQAKA